MVDGLDVPVVLLAYNRPQLTRRVFDAIAQARPSRLFVVCDGAHDDRPDDALLCEEVQDIVTAVDWPCKLSKNMSPKNLGCGLRVSSGLDWVFRSVDSAIILEDDCLPCQDFFSFCREMLLHYKDDSRIGTIAGTNLAHGIKRFPQSYLYTKYFACWGWATWRRTWAHYDWKMAGLSAAVADDSLRSALGREDATHYFAAAFERARAGDIDTWAYPMLYHCLMSHQLHVIPTWNLVSNIGFATDATHTIDAVSRDANLPLEGLPRPIEHPSAFVTCRAFDRIIERHHLGLQGDE